MLKSIDLQLGFRTDPYKADLTEKRFSTTHK